VFTFSAHNGADQRMWIRAFEILLELKTIALALKKGEPIPESSSAWLKSSSPSKIAMGIEKSNL